MRNHLVNIQSFDKALRTNLVFIGAAFLFLLFGQNVNVAAQQLGSQLDILAAAADGQRKLFLRNNRLNTVVFLVQNHLGDFGRRQGADNVLRLVLGIRNNIDFLALQFRNHRLYANTAQTDAGADRINRHIVGFNGDFGF